ncbi:response regulator transcription factor [Priestia flexa]|uniref:response regulator transcription factor n=1 Tax=Priestia flexa TaxID=86664 RepID=UPI00077C1717|nr:response regulator transcription factor [Priestia flexa]MCA1202911.1 response regulator transcription factor [Priestia flexa]MCP1187858.1 response regulator transcription factor [Priestia flexa]MED3825741.1 response regulator transcription factor [Priestia flexa]MED4587174.1 response regulator transcription factor [Priestia flexa]QCS54539.1 response regulator transcription factor [Priestia flexa]
MSKGKILIIEDEKKIARLIQLELEYEGYETATAHTGTEGLSLFQSQQFDLLILDVMLPGLSGLEVLRRIRSTNQLTPVILLTARDSLPDKISGLDLGANDYMTKPFEIEELLARIRVWLRNQSTAIEENPLLQIGDLTVDEKTRIVTREKNTIELTPREFDLLIYLLKNQNQVLSREQLLTNVWGFDYYGDTNVVDVYIRYLRKKLDAPYSTPYLHTVRGVGYMLKE